MTTPSTPCLQRNRDLFAARFPEALAAADKTPATRSCITEGDDGQAVNIDLDGGSLYPSPEPTWSQRQFESHRTEPDRIGLANPSYCNLSTVSLHLLEHIRTHMEQRFGTDPLPPVPFVDVGYLFVLGLGLGYQLPMLLRTTSARRIIIIEPFPEFVHHSLAAIDWEEAIRLADERQIALHFVFGDDPDILLQRTESLIGQHGNTFLDGSELFASYYAWVLEETYRKLRERLKTYYVTSGFFEDEIEMMQNTLANLHRWEFHLLEDRPHLEQGHPVFLVGAGPSLDADMVHLHRLRDRAIIVSCGTAIGILLKNGIRPDLHCELERGELVYDLLSVEHARYGFDGIRLIASTTVDPRIGGLFEERWLFFRGSLSPSRLLIGKSRPLHNAAPLCCNAAFSAVAALGYKNIFLFGIDLGQREDGRHHARDSVYYDSDKEALDQLYRRRFDRTVPGNFGGQVQTWWAFDSGRRAFDVTQRLWRVNLANCSDGARIEGARPRVAAALQLPLPALPRERTLAQTERQMRHVTPGALLAEVDLPPHIAACDRFVAHLDELLAEIQAEGGGFYELDDRLARSLRENSEIYAGYSAMARGSLAGMLRLGHFFSCRLPDPADRQAFFAFFTDRYRERVMYMAQQIKDLLASTADAVAAAAEPTVAAAAE